MVASGGQGGSTHGASLNVEPDAVQVRRRHLRVSARLHKREEVHLAERRTRVVLSVPWDDEWNDHPAHWGWDVLLQIEDPLGVLLVDFEEVDDDGNPIAV
jgi:hypothetical protein